MDYRGIQHSGLMLEISLKTNSNYRDAEVNWELTQLKYYKKCQTKNAVTQGF
jgi:hypothetical protein